MTDVRRMNVHDADFIRALIATYTIAPTTDWLTPSAA